MIISGIAKIEWQGRRSIRQKGHDYSRKSDYFVTICLQHRSCLLGGVKDREMFPNEAGVMVREQWSLIPERYPSVKLGEFIVMPNHLHGIISMLSPQRTVVGIEGEGQLSLTIGQVIGTFKSITTWLYTKGVKNSGWKSFDGRLWQRNYFEKAIRNESEMAAYVLYIRNNSKNWSEDQLFNDSDADK